MLYDKSNVISRSLKRLNKPAFLYYLLETRKSKYVDKEKEVFQISWVAFELRSHLHSAKCNVFTITA